MRYLCTPERSPITESTEGSLRRDLPRRIYCPMQSAKGLPVQSRTVDVRPKAEGEIVSSRSAVVRVSLRFDQRLMRWGGVNF